ncbi:uncharacterized protein LOC133815361 [Humulus lupulus]|uniref:uncharacterized protein LOC133815361 n=1 Tax=Humulus lupulus TaxID=3486 RepID=UPI002B4102A8|nr:uncharacterized protein LOC133815361 [Humulus lupulus]
MSQEKKKQGIIENNSGEEKVTKGLAEKEVVPPVSIEHDIKILYAQRLPLEQIPRYVKFMKEIRSNKRKMGDYETVALNEECSAILQRMLPQKLRDPGSFTIPCTIWDFECKLALCDLGASINLMLLSVFRRLGLGEARPTIVTLQLADRPVKHPRGIIEDVMVKVDNFIFLKDFIVFNVGEDENVPIIQGRPFLATGPALIKVQKGQLRLRVQGDEVVLNMEQNLVKDLLVLSLTIDDIDEEDYEEGVSYLNWIQSYRPLREKRFEEIGQGPERPLPSIENPLVLELKALPKHLCNAYRGAKETLPVIVSTFLTEVEVEKLLKGIKSS